MRSKFIQYYHGKTGIWTKHIIWCCCEIRNSQATVPLRLSQYVPHTVIHIWFGPRGYAEEKERKQANIFQFQFTSSAGKSSWFWSWSASCSGFRYISAPSWKPLTKRARIRCQICIRGRIQCGSVSVIQCTVPRILLRLKTSRIRNTGFHSAVESAHWSVSCLEYRYRIQHHLLTGRERSKAVFGQC